MIYSLKFLFFVVSPGFEPRQAVPKTAVLPLHHETNICFSKAIQKYIINLIYAIPKLYFFYFAISK